MREKPRFALFDSLRAIAALAVVGTHVGHASGVSPKTGLGLFTSHLIEGTPTPSLGRYSTRRFLRIVPAYWVALSLLAL